jgi:hypothetical protein
MIDTSFRFLQYVVKFITGSRLGFFFAPGE